MHGDACINNKDIIVSDIQSNPQFVLSVIMLMNFSQIIMIFFYDVIVKCYAWQRTRVAIAECQSSFSDVIYWLLTGRLFNNDRLQHLTQ